MLEPDFKKSYFLIYLMLAGNVITHTMYIFFFKHVGSDFMSIINVFSVLFYVTLYLVFLLRKTLRVLNIAFYEVCIQAFLASITLGLNSGFELFPVCTVFAGYHLVSITKSRKVNAYFLICFAFVLLLSMRFLPAATDLSFLQVYPDKSSLDFIYIYNSIVAFTMVSLIMFIFFSDLKSDEEKLKLQNTKLSELANMDSLTHLLNRRAMKQRLEAALASKHNYNVEFVIAIVDIDDFKKINDHYGHDCGDTVLKKVVHIISENVRETDYVARWGGDEILILFNKSSMDGAFSSINRIHKEIGGTPFIYNGQSLAVTITIGVCPSENYFMYQDIILEADRRLYDGKHKGKNCIVYGTTIA